MRKLLLLSALTLGLAAAQADETQASLRGAGSTLATPLMRVWAEEYQKYRLGAVTTQVSGAGLDDITTRPALDYEAIGSSAGLERLKAGQKDFAVSERPMSSAELRKAGLRQIPVAVSGLAIVTNVPGVPSLKLTGSVLADIYLGKIRTWNDPAITRLNPGLKLPAQAIRPVYRSDGSGSTYALSGYLSAVSPAWKKALGQDTKLDWPVGVGARQRGGARYGGDDAAHHRLYQRRTGQPRPYECGEPGQRERRGGAAQPGQSDRCHPGDRLETGQRLCGEPLQRTRQDQLPAGDGNLFSLP